MRSWQFLGVALRLGAQAAPRAMLGLSSLAVLTAAIPLSAAWLTKVMIDRLIAPATTWPDLAGVVLALVTAGMAAAIIPHFQRYLQAEFARRTAFSAQDTLYRSINGYTGLCRFEDPQFLDRLRVAQHAGQHAPAEVVAGVLSLLQLILTGTGFFVSLLFLSPYIAWVVLLGAVPALVSELRLARARYGATMRSTRFERREVFYAMLLSDVQAAKEVRLFGIGEFLRGRMQTERKEINHLQHGVDRRTALTQTGLTSLSAAVTGASLVWAVWSASRGILTVGEISLFVAAVAMVQSSLGHLAAGIALLHHHLLVLAHYHAVTTAGPDLGQPRSSRAVPALRSGIELRDVWFRYSEQHPWILRGISLTIPFGQTVGLVGVNGAGKSTLVKLLCRFYDPVRGAIYWDGVDLREVAVETLRDRISAIFQDFMQYDLTAAENIAVGDIDVAGDRSKLRRAADIAGIGRDIARLPRGYDTMLSRDFGEPDDDGMGVMLSGGQWQRLAIARALLRHDRDLLILDEPSSGLDAAAEHEIHARLRHSRTGWTNLLVSHRLGVMRTADTVVVIDDGIVAEAGSHDELMRTDGQYARLFRLQAQGYDPVLTR